MEEKEFNIDKALQHLDEINRRLSEEGLPLSESLTLYKDPVLHAHD